MAKFYPIIFVHGWGGSGDLVRDFSAADERDPDVRWNTGHRYNDLDGWRMGIQGAACQNSLEDQAMRAKLRVEVIRR